jgi:hypothetical protein
MGILYGRAGRLTAQNGGFRRGQVRVAQQANDATALGYAVMWLLSVVKSSRAGGSRLQGAAEIAKHSERLLRRG